MCCGAMVNTGLGTLVLGARLARLRMVPSGQAFGAFGDYTVERMAALIGSRLQLVTGVLTEECERLYQGARITVNG
jgi:tRNA(Arg) A34 adenosine deaminase TadA